MIQIYTNSNQDLSKNGIIINPISCTISPKMNADNELEMEFAIDKEGLYKYIQNNNFIAVPTPDFDESQLYRIYDTKKSMSGHSITAYARHIKFDLAKNIIFNKTITAYNGQQALDRILENTPFTGHSDIAIQDIRQYKMRSVLNTIAGSENDSFINVWGGEISCNNYNLTINTKRGSDKGIRVTFGYNLDDIEEDLNFDDVITRLYPYSGDLVLSISTPYVDSPLISNIGVLEDAIEFSDIKVKENQEDIEGYATRAEAEAEMIRRCNKLYFKGLDKITANYVVKMQSLSKTREYKELGYDVLEKICLGDTVHCYNKNIDIEVEARCISYKWDCINEEYIEIVLGDFVNDYINIQNSKIDNLYRQIQLTEQNILLKVTSLDGRLSSRIELDAKKITAVVESSDGGATWQLSKNAFNAAVESTGLKSTLDLQSNKISAVVESSDGGMTWTLKEDAFVIACKNASGQNVTIDADGLTINDGKLFLKNSSDDIVFEVDLNGICNAIGGFIVRDGDTSCFINSEGMKLIGPNSGEANIKILDDGEHTGVHIPDDLYVTDWLGVGRAANFEGEVFVGGITLQDYIMNVIDDVVKPDSLI